MQWKKIGRIFCPENNYAWMLTHAANPVATFLDDKRVRIFFSCRDKINRSSIAYVDINIDNPLQVIGVSNEPVLSPGMIGAFDDSGVSMGCITKINHQWYLYYLGWNLGVTVPWRNSIGLAISDSLTGKFIRYSQAPLIDRAHVDPYSLSYPWVMFDEDRWKLWYGSHLNWRGEHEMSHLIKYAESENAVTWNRQGKIALNFQAMDEFAITKPCVIKENNLYKMWYSYRGKTYRIGYAESKNGIDWVRKDDKMGLNVSSTGWDSEMIEYPFVFDHEEKRYMLYNGNGYGKTGFGIAVLE